MLNHAIPSAAARAVDLCKTYGTDDAQVVALDSVTVQSAPAATLPSGVGAAPSSGPMSGRSAQVPAQSRAQVASPRHHALDPTSQPRSAVRSRSRQTPC